MTQLTTINSSSTTGRRFMPYDTSVGSTREPRYLITPYKLLEVTEFGILAFCKNLLRAEQTSKPISIRHSNMEKIKTFDCIVGMKTLLVSSSELFTLLSACTDCGFTLTAHLHLYRLSRLLLNCIAVYGLYTIFLFYLSMFSMITTHDTKRDLFVMTREWEWECWI